MTDDHRALLLRAAVGFTLVSPDEPELKLLHRWLDCWRGVGDVVSGMKRQGYEVSLGDHGSGQWIAVFYAGHGGLSAVGSGGYGPSADPVGGGATSSVGGSRESGESVVRHPFLLPFIRLELLIRSIRTTHWDPETWPTVKVELRRALSLRRGRA